MFFYLSKIIWALLDPANLMTLLFAAALLFFALKKIRVGKFLLLSSFLILFVFGVLPVGHNGLYYVETRITSPDSLPQDIDGMIVLGGAIETLKSESSGRTEFNEGAERVLSALALSRSHPQAKIVFSGGSARLVNNERSETVEVARFLKTMGYKTGNVIYENTSRNTYENLRNTKNLVQPEKGQNWLLITSSYHMPRSLAVARKLGWDLIPYPVDYRSYGRYLLFPPRFDVLDNFYASKIFLREMTGLAAYKLTGKL